MRKGKVSLGIIVAIVSMSGQVLAKEIRSDDGKVTIRYDLAHLNHSVANGLGVTHDDGPYNFLSQPDNGATLSDWGNLFEGEVVIPYTLMIFGREYHPFFRFGHEKVDADVHELRSVTNWSTNGNFIDLLPIDGSPASNWYFGLSSPDEKIGVDYSIYEQRNYANIGLETQFNAAESLRFSLYYSRQKTTLQSSVYHPSDPVGTSLKLDEAVKGYSIGPSAQYHIEFGRTGPFSLFATLGAALVYSKGKLDADQSAQGTQWHVEDSRHDIGIHADAQLGVNYHFGKNLVLSLFGGAGYRNDVYEIINPRAKEGENINNPSSYHPAPAHLDRVGEQTFHVGARLSYKF